MSRDVAENESRSIGFINTRQSGTRAQTEREREGMVGQSCVNYKGGCVVDGE